MILPILVVISGGLLSPLQAQEDSGKREADSLSTSLFPVVAFSSEKGFIGGAVYSRNNFSGEIMPYKNKLQLGALVSTKGFIKIDGEHEQTKILGRSLRATTEVYFHRYSRDTFFGVDNNSGYSGKRWDEGYYYFESVSFGLDFNLRKRLYSRGGSKLYASGGVGTDYQVPHVRKDVSSFKQATPNGSRGGWVNYLTVGVVWDNRNSEIDPRRGNRAEVKMRYAPKPISSYGLASVQVDLRQYVHLFDLVTAAARLQGRHVGGNVPYWELSTLGDQYTLRGYARNRFQGSTSLFYNIELRSWLVEFPKYSLRIGSLVFTDGGRVFTAEDSLEEVFSEYRHTVGFGGTVSIFNPDFFLRGEMGFSDEVSRIYVGVGYLF